MPGKYDAIDAAARKRWEAIPEPPTAWQSAHGIVSRSMHAMSDAVPVAPQGASVPPRKTPAWASGFFPTEATLKKVRTVGRHIAARTAAAVLSAKYPYGAAVFNTAADHYFPMPKGIRRPYIRKPYRAARRHRSSFPYNNWRRKRARGRWSKVFRRFRTNRRRRRNIRHRAARKIFRWYQNRVFQRGY